MANFFLTTAEATETASKTIGEILRSKSITLEGVVDFLQHILVTYVPKLLFALVLLWVGLKIIKVIKGSIGHIMELRQCDRMLVQFLQNTADIALKVLLVITVVNEVGIPTTAFLTVFASAGLAIGLAMQGTLQNFAGGFIILLFKPFKVDDDVEFGGERGIVKQIQIFNTIIESAKDNKVLIVPNSQISSATLINYSAERFRRLDQVYGIAYGSSVDQARAIILDLLKKDDRFMPNPYIEGSELEIVVSSLSDSSVDIMVRAWVKPVDYFDATFKLNEDVYKGFNEAGIEIPFPQVQIHTTK